MRRPARSRFVRLPGLRMHLLDWPGDAPPVLLLHPNRTNARVWDFTVEQVRLARRFLAPDYRGHGLSDYPPRGYLYDDYLADLEALLAAESIERVDLVGAATGGNLALLLASRRPALVRRLVVVDPGLSLDPSISRRVRGEMAREFRFQSRAIARERMPFSARWSERMKDHYAEHAFEALADGSVHWRYFPPGVIETEASLEHPIWDRIDVRAPTLVVRGAHSAVFPPANRARLVAMIPGAASSEIDADHRVMQDNPAALAAALDAFLA